MTPTRSRTVSPSPGRDDLDAAGAVARPAGAAALAGPDRELPAADLEVALLARGNGRRCFRRLDDDEVTALLPPPAPPATPAPDET